MGRVRSYRAFSPLPRRSKLHILRFAASGKAHSFRCFSSPHRNLGSGGAPFGECGTSFVSFASPQKRQSSFAPLFLLSPPELRFRRGPRLGRQSKLHIVRFAASGKAYSFRCFSFPQWGDAAVSFCCTGPGVTPGGRYPLSLPCGARTFLTGGLSASPRGCPTRSPGYCNPFKRDCQMSCKIFFRRLYYR